MACRFASTRPSKGQSNNVLCASHSYLPGKNGRAITLNKMMELLESFSKVVISTWTDGPCLSWIHELRIIRFAHCLDSQVVLESVSVEISLWLRLKVSRRISDDWRFREPAVEFIFQLEPRFLLQPKKSLNPTSWQSHSPLLILSPLYAAWREWGFRPRDLDG